MDSPEVVQLAMSRSSSTESMASTSSSGSRRKRHRGDRFIPVRDESALKTTHDLLYPQVPLSRRIKRSGTRALFDSRTEESNQLYDTVLHVELFGTGPIYSSTSRAMTPIRPSLLSFSPSNSSLVSVKRKFSLDSPHHASYRVSPVHFHTQALLERPNRQPLFASKVPYKVLDAPRLVDDFYRSSVDFSSSDHLAVALDTAVWLWRESEGQSHVNRLVDLASFEPTDTVRSVSWMQQNSGHLAIGTEQSLVHIYDVQQQRRVRTLRGHEDRVGALAWNGPVLSTGSLDAKILHRDVRTRNHSFAVLAGHSQEVCALKWDTDGTRLASGGNDNKAFVFQGMNKTHTHKFAHHAAVKAIAWSPHQSGLLATGGGIADGMLRFWNATTGVLLSQVFTGSQISNMLWSKISSELVTTHGFSRCYPPNQVNIWRYGPPTVQIATLPGHNRRVLFVTGDSSGENIVTGAGDETIRFWHAFPRRAAPVKKMRSALSLDMIR